MDQPGKVANPARGQLNMENENSPVPVRSTCLRIWSRETSSVVPSRVSSLILHTQAESGAYSRDSSRFPRRGPFIYLNRHTSLGQCLLFYRVTQLRTKDVYCRESTGTGPVVLKVVPITTNGCCHFAGHHGPINMRLSFPTPTIGMKWAC